MGANSGLGGPTIGSTTIPAAQAADLPNQLWYINIHKDLYPGGEIRGQVVPEPTSLGLVLGGLVLFAARRERRRWGGPNSLDADTT